MNNKYKKIAISLVAAASGLSLLSSVALAKSSNNGKDEDHNKPNVLSVATQRIKSSKI